MREATEQKLDLDDDVEPQAVSAVLRYAYTDKVQIDPVSLKIIFPIYLHLRDLLERNMLLICCHLHLDFQ